MDRPTSALRTFGSQTWAVPLHATVPPRPTAPHPQRRPSLTVHPPSTSSDSDDEDTFKPNRSHKRTSGHRLAYKPSFSKPTFQWMRGELLGKGSYGRVYLALNATTGEVMAVKQVELPKTASDKMNHQQLDVMKALKFEGDTLKDLDHPNIVSYLGFEESQDYLSIFLEYVSGGTVGSLLHKYGRLREEVTKSWLGQMLKGLDYLHSKGILHRDLKADNILVEHSGVCKISDFGISKKAGEINRGKAYTTMKGTAFWMAPEILSNEGNGYDVKVDIWSVGCVAVEMWTGKRPWYGEQMIPVMMKVVTQKLPPPLPSDIPMTELAKDFQSVCFNPDPCQRPHAAVLMKHAYLEVPSNWVFNWEDLADNPRPPRTYPELIPLRESRSLSTFTSTKTPMQKPKQPKPPLPTLKIPVWNNSTVSTPGTESSQTVGPPVVFITPPNTPRKTPKPDEHSASTSASGDRTFSKRRYVVSNPDDAPDPRPSRTHNRKPVKPAFVYTPPPLPEPFRTVHGTSPQVRSQHQAESSSIGSMAPHSSIPTRMTESPSLLRPEPSSTALRSPPRPLPQSPPVPRSAPLQISTPRRRPGSSRERSHTIDTSVVRSYEEGSQTAKSSVYNLPISSSSSSTVPRIRRLPISPKNPQHHAKASSAILPTMRAPPSRTVMKQKSVPDVSIFTYDPRSSKPPRNPAPRSSFDSELDDRDSLHSDDGSTSSSHSTTRGSGHTQRRESLWAMRPRTEDVYEDLEAWFPNHDLDQPVDNPGSSTLPSRQDTLDAVSASRPKRNHPRMSVRMIAKEQNRLSHMKAAHARRRTMLWNTHMEELKDNR